MQDGAVEAVQFALYHGPVCTDWAKSCKLSQKARTHFLAKELAQHFSDKQKYFLLVREVSYDFCEVSFDVTFRIFPQQPIRMLK